MIVGHSVSASVAITARPCSRDRAAGDGEERRNFSVENSYSR